MLSFGSDFCLESNTKHQSLSIRMLFSESYVDDVWQIADAGDQELRRLAHRHSSGRGTMELGAEDNNGLSQQACAALAEE